MPNAAYMYRAFVTEMLEDQGYVGQIRCEDVTGICELLEVEKKKTQLDILMYNFNFFFKMQIINYG